MEFTTFLNKYDKPGAVILLEGKRKVKGDDKQYLIELGRLLTRSSKHLCFRSGNASGADAYFSEGVASIDPKRLQIIMPYKKHRIKERLTENIISLDEINLTQNSEVVLLSKKNKSISSLIDKYLLGHRTNFTHKASYILRDTIKVVGSATIPPTSFALFYDNLNNPGKGGTGHTMLMCQQKNVGYVNQQYWMKWL